MVTSRTGHGSFSQHPYAGASASTNAATAILCRDHETTSAGTRPRARGHQGLDLGARAAVPRVRLRRPRGAAGGGEEPGLRQRQRLAAGAGAARRRGSARPRASGRRWSTPATSATCTGSSATRVRMMLAVDDPLFEDWDQDEAAVAGAYGDQDPATVADELVERGRRRRPELYGSVEGPQWDRPGRRSNGSVFTVHTPGALPPARRRAPPPTTSPADVASAPCGTRSSGRGWSTRWVRRTPAPGPSSR